MSFKDWIKKQPCIVGLSCMGRIHCHHIKTRGAGGKDESNLLPLCAKHHYELHKIGKDTFAKKYNLNYEYLKRVFFRLYKSGGENGNKMSI